MMNKAMELRTMNNPEYATVVNDQGQIPQQQQMTGNSSPLTNGLSHSTENGTGNGIAEYRHVSAHARFGEQPPPYSAVVTQNQFTNVGQNSNGHGPDVQRNGRWKYGLCSCLHDIHLATSTCIMPCVTFGNVSKAVRHDTCTLATLKFLIPVYNVFYWAKRRAQMREALGIPGSERNDCLTILCCSYCALMQEAQEVLPCTQPISQRIYRY